MLSPGLAAIASVAVAVLWLMVRGVRGSVSLGPVHLGFHDYLKPLGWGLLAAAALLIREADDALWRRLATTLLAVLGALAIVNFAIQTAPIITVADIAVSELYVELATRGRLLLGAYSRFGWHHPGPFYFYVVAPFYALSGHQAAALFAAALAINLAALAVMLWVLVRETAVFVTVPVLGVALVFAWRLPWFLASPWNAHVVILPSLAFLVAAAAVAAGRVRLLPLAIVLGTFAAQTHVGFVPVVLGVTAALVLSLVVGHRGGLSPWPAIRISMWVAAGLWLLPFSEAIANGGGNVAALWRFFVTDAGAGHSVREALVNGSYGLVGVLRPDFALPWGGHFDLHYLGWGVPCAIAEVIGLTVIARRAFGSGRRFDGCLAVVALAATAISLWGLTRLRGDILNHDIFRLSAVGALDAGIVVGEVLRVVSASAGDRWRRPAAALTSYALLGVGAVSLGVRDLTTMTVFEQTRRERVAVVDSYVAVRDYVAAEGVRKPLVRVGADRASDAVGVVLRLLQGGTPAAVMDADLTVFSAVFAATGDEDAVVTFADLDLHRQLREQPENVILLQAFPLFVDATKRPPRRPGGGD